jgi:hypothetical protein
MYVKFSYMNSSADLNGDDDGEGEDKDEDEDEDESKEKEEDSESILKFIYFIASSL